MSFLEKFFKKRSSEKKEERKRGFEHVGFVQRLKRRLGGEKLSEEDLEELEEELILSDVGAEVAKELVDETRKLWKKGAKDLKSAFVEAVVSLLGKHEKSWEPEKGRMNVYLFFGVNGSGKTTTIAKLAHRYKDRFKTLVVAADTYRAAAVEQLEIWAKKVGVRIVRGEEGGDSGAVVYNGIQSAIAKGDELVLVDTAGRLHTRRELMEELAKLNRVLSRLLPENARVLRFLVIDGSTGQNGLKQAEKFEEAVKVDFVVLTKMDGTAKGGVVLAIKKRLGIPVAFLGVGEGPEDLVPFDAEEFALNISG